MSCNSPKLLNVQKWVLHRLQTVSCNCNFPIGELQVLRVQPGAATRWGKSKLLNVQLAFEGPV